jgi:hypothetical protein
VRSARPGAKPTDPVLWQCCVCFRDLRYADVGGYDQACRWCYPCAEKADRARAI